jgi:hypothetical protein
MRTSPTGAARARAGPTRPPARPRLGALDATAISTLQRSAGNAAVQRLVKLTEPPRPERTLTRRERRAFVNAEMKTRRDKAEGMEVMRDMAAARDELKFGSRDELRTELTKRVVMTEIMQDSQITSRGLSGFGYPFTRPSLYWGPRVGFDAKDFWEPAPPDGYDLRADPAKRARIRALPRGERHTVYGDQDEYSFKLSPKGVADPFEAIMTLFVRHPPHKRTLIHCDYLISLVHFRALMATLGKPAFNAKITAYGPARITLRWDLFRELQDSLPDTAPGTTRPGLGSIRRISPTSPADLVIGDHVFFHNHKAYDVINDRIGNAWRLENAVLVARPRGTDIFLGHGSGRKTAADMRAKLAEEYNDVALMALRLVQKTKRGSGSARTAARAEIAAEFPGVRQVSGKWRVVGTGIFDLPVDIPLTLLRPSQIPGLFDPGDPTKMFPVRRPVESA